MAFLRSTGVNSTTKMADYILLLSFNRQWLYFSYVAFLFWPSIFNIYQQLIGEHSVFISSKHIFYVITGGVIFLNEFILAI